MPDLRRYREKRDPDKTPEPFGEASSMRRVGPGARRAFVVQQHAARRMHWDLRLEIDGVLVSWAVPRGPTLDPKERRLAVRTEDHPLEYANFEGIIPAGNYGAGAMIVWDSGSYHTVAGSAPSDGLDTGKLDLVFEGHKLRGRFALVRTRGEDGRQWLLLRKGDPPVDSAELVDAEPESVLSGLTVADLEGGVSRIEDVRARSLAAGASPERRQDSLDRWKRLRPMLASKREDPFTDRRWLFELKYDGFRALALKSDDRIRLQSRTGRDFTSTYREVAHALSHLPVDRLVLDGEIVALDAQGRSSFERLQQRFMQTDSSSLDRAPLEIPVVFYAFDLLFASDYDLRKCPLSIRKEILSCVVPRAGPIRYADHVEGDGEALFGAVHQHGLEGVVAKRADAPYETGRRSKTWVKIKVPRAAHLVIVGFVPGRGSRKALGSLMLAWNDEQGLVYAGNAGSGLGERELDELLPLLEASRVPEPLFAGAPAPGTRGAVYVRPLHVVEISFTEVTRSGRLRHPVFVRLEPDRAPHECRAPAARTEPETVPEAPPPAGTELVLTRLDKVFWPLEGYTKGDLLEYYEAAWPWLAPYLRDRPVVLTRYPDGIEGKHFYQKNAPEFTPDWVESERIEGTDYFVCNDLRTLLYVINSGAIPLHVWSARRSSIERPDWLILDLDPKQAPFTDVVKVARHIHSLLRELGAPHYVKTSGQDGLHVLLPLDGRLDHRDTRSLAEVLARVVCADLPEIATITRPVSARGEKVYVDYLQNGHGKLIAGPFSVRPRAAAPVSMPLTWAQVTSRLDPKRYTIRTVPRLMEQRGDPMRGVLEDPIDVELVLEALAERLARSVAS